MKTLNEIINYWIYPLLDERTDQLIRQGCKWVGWNRFGIALWEHFNSGKFFAGQAIRNVYKYVGKTTDRNLMFVSMLNEAKEEERIFSVKNE